MSKKLFRKSYDAWINTGGIACVIHLGEVPKFLDVEAVSFSQAFFDDPAEHQFAKSLGEIECLFCTNKPTIPAIVARTCWQSSELYGIVCKTCSPDANPRRMVRGIAQAMRSAIFT